MYDTGNFIGLFRCLIDKPIWFNSTPQQKTILITILLKANWKESEWEWQGQKFKLNPGQFVSSLENLVKASGKGISIQNVRTSITRFEKLEFLTNESTKTGRLITVLNWHMYQVERMRPNKATNIDLTKTQQRPNKDLTTIEELKELNKLKTKDPFCPKSDEIILTNFLLDKIKGNNPKFKEPNIQQWAKEMDYILRVDKRSIEDVRKTIEWCQNDSFWKTNVLSVVKLRNKFDMLYVKMNSVKEQPKGKEKETVNFAELIKKQEEIK